jgi:hypothetical protein
MILEKRETTHHPPKDARECVILVLADFAAAQSAVGEMKSD